MLADGTLTVNRAVDVSVARQTTSLPSSSTPKSAAPGGSLEREVEGRAFAAGSTDNFVSTPSGEPADTVDITQAQAEATEQFNPQISSNDASEDPSPAEQARSEEKERLERITQELNQKLNENLALRFGEDKETGQEFFQLIEKETGDVVRQVPSEEILEFMKRFQSFSGLLFSQQA